MINNKIYLALSLNVLGLLFLSPLQAMEMELDTKNSRRKSNENKENIDTHRERRDRLLKGKNFHDAEKYSVKVVYKDPKSETNFYYDREHPDQYFNQNATIDDFRRARDISSLLAKQYTGVRDLRINDARIYATRVLSYKGRTQEDVESMEELEKGENCYENDNDLSATI